MAYGRVLEVCIVRRSIERHSETLFRIDEDTLERGRWNG